MKKLFLFTLLAVILLTSCFGPRAISSTTNPKLSGTEVKFEKLMNLAFSEEYIDADIITYVEFYEATPNKYEMVKVPRGYIAFQVLAINGSTKETAWGKGESGFHVLIEKDKGKNIFDYKKGTKLKLRGGTYVTKVGGFGVSNKMVSFKATSIEVVN